MTIPEPPAWEIRRATLEKRVVIQGLTVGALVAIIEAQLLLLAAMQARLETRP